MRQSCTSVNTLVAQANTTTAATIATCAHAVEVWPREEEVGNIMMADFT